MLCLLQHSDSKLAENNPTITCVQADSRSIYSCAIYMAWTPYPHSTDKETECVRVKVPGGMLPIHFSFYYATVYFQTFPLGIL